VSNETPAEMTTASLSAMKLPELKALAASRGLKGISQLRKPQLIELLSNDASAPTTPAAAPRDEAPASSQDSPAAPAPEAAPSEAPAADACCSGVPYCGAPYWGAPYCGLPYCGLPY